MTAKLYAEVNQHTIEQLKKQGFTSVQFALLDEGNPYQATIELIPDKGADFELDKVSLYSTEIHDYMDGHERMTRYIIDREYVNPSITDKIPAPS
jgi:hypothetical protein